MDKSKKTGTIVISLVPEAETINEKEIEKQIKKECFIPFCAEVEEVVIGKLKKS